MPHKILVAQGGGPTAVINQSLVGVALEATPEGEPNSRRRVRKWPSTEFQVLRRMRPVMYRPSVIGRPRWRPKEAGFPPNKFISLAAR
jgi:hypothetical protein